MLAPAALLADEPASADAFVLTPASGDAVGGLGAPSAATPRLPHGVHFRDGRYFQDLCGHGWLQCMGRRVLPESYVPYSPPPPPRTKAEAPQGMGPSDVLTAYNVPSSSAANGRIVAIIDSPDSQAYTDLSTYRSAYGLPALPRCTGNPTGALPACFAQVAEDGGPSTGANTCSSEQSCDDGETSLDTQMISAVCPDCSILLVETNLDSGTGADLVAAVATAARLGASAINISFGGVEATDPSSQCATVSGANPVGFTTPGHLVVAASGDYGYEDENCGGTAPAYPASAPDVLAVGGTTLKAGSPYTEIAWNDGTGGQDATVSGCSTEFAQPSWQVPLLSSSGCGKRALVDVSAVAAFSDSTGTSIYIASYTGGNGGDWAGTEGTSAAAPLVAALLTRVGLTTTISNDLGWPYANASAFNDVTTGDDDSNGACNNLLCKSQVGWDGPTGVGTPNATALLALVGSSSGNVSSGSGSGSGSEGDSGSSDDFGSSSAESSGDDHASVTTTTSCTAAGPASAPIDGLAVLAFAGAAAALARRRRATSARLVIAGRPPQVITARE